MRHQHRLITIGFILLLVASVATVFAVPVMEHSPLDELRQQLQEDEPSQKAPPEEFVHKHAYLFFLVNGERKNLGDAYIERDRNVHFHHDDGVVHVEGPDANLSTAMNTLNITINESCVRYGLDDETYCETPEKEPRFVIEGENVTRADWLNHTIQQDDNIILYYGEKDAAVPDKYFEPLPNGYAPGYESL